MESLYKFAIPGIIGLIFGVQNLPTEPKTEAVQLTAFQLPPNPLADDTEDETPKLSASDRFDQAARLFDESRKELRELWKNGKVQNGDGCTCDCNCPDENRLRQILREELAATRSTFSGGSSGGSTSFTPRSYVVPNSVTITETTTPITPVASKTVTRTYRYTASDGCVHRVTEYSDGSRSDVTVSCPANRTQTQSKRPNALFPNAFWNK